MRANPKHVPSWLSRTLLLLSFLAALAGCSQHQRPGIVMGEVATFPSDMAPPIEVMGGLPATSRAAGATAVPTAAPAPSPRKAEPVAPEASDRMLIWRASLDIEVASVRDAAERAGAMTRVAGGYVERNREDGEKSANLTLRIPAKAFQESITDFERLGKVTERDVRGEDVTDQYVDTAARLQSKVALRDRLRALLDKAVDVRDVMGIETELGRLQADIDAMEARLKSLAARIDYATVDLNLHRKRILGPLGHVFKGIGWAIEKLFVIRE